MNTIMIGTRLRLSVLVSAVALTTACADPPTGAAPHTLRTGSGAAQLTCEVQIAPASAALPGVSAGSSAAVTCRPAAGSGVQNAPRAGSGATRTISAADSILEDQGTDISIQFDSVQMSTNVLTLERTLTAWVSVTNMLSVDIGTTDGVTPAPNGTRVFISSGPSTMSGLGIVTIGNPTGLGTFTGPEQPYFEYDGILAPMVPSATIGWQFVSAPAVSSFTFNVGVDAATP